MSPLIKTSLPLSVIAALALAGVAPAAVVFLDDFSAHGMPSNDVNQFLTGLEGDPAPTDPTIARQSGSAGEWHYMKDTVSDANSAGDTQLGNPATAAGQDPSNVDYLLIAYYGGITCDLPLDDFLAQGGPLTVSFDMTVTFPPNNTDDGNWIAFRLGTIGASTWPVVDTDTGFAFLYRINKALQVFTTGGTNPAYPAVTSNHFDVVMTDAAGTGSAFTGDGTLIKLYNGGVLVDTFTTAQFGQVFMNFKIYGAFGSVDNLQVATGVPVITPPTTPLALTGSSFDFTGSKVNLTFNSQVGTTYQVTHSTSLTGAWTALGSAITASSASTSTSVNFTKTDKDFFRVEQVPTP